MDDDSLDPTRRKPLQDNLGMGPLSIAPPMMNGVAGVPPISRPAYETPSAPSSPTSPASPTMDKTPMGGALTNQNPHQAEIQRLEDTGSGVSQVQQKHPFWGGVLRGLDVAASIAAPRIAPAIPGTTAHHDMLIHQQEGLANQDLAQEHAQAETQDIQQRPQMQQAVMQHQDQLEAQKEAARQQLAEQAQREQQQHIDQQTGQQQDRLDQQGEIAAQRAKETEANMNARFAESEKLAGMREAGMEHRADARAGAKADQLTPATQGILQSISPVKDQVDQLISALTPYEKGGRLTMDRLGYALGEDSPEGSLASEISKLSLDRVIAGARVLKGSSRAYQALEISMQHAPNPWIDKPALMLQKLRTIRQNLDDVEQDAVKYGVKGQTATQAQQQLHGGNAAPSGPPSGATGIAPGSDGKNHYHDAKGTDLGVAP